MKYAWASITKSAFNFGNFLIEKSLRQLLDQQGFGEPTLVFDAYKPQSIETLNKINSLDFLIIPGCTTLTFLDYPGIDSVVKQSTIPIYNIGAAFMHNLDDQWLNDYKRFFQPIGTRDPASHSFLIKHGIPSQFIGCPTLFLGDAKKYARRKTNKVLFIFALKEIERQKTILQYLIDRQLDVGVITQEKFHQDLIADLPVRIIDYDPDIILNEIKKARLMITGRLHGTLPSIANGTPTFFINTVTDTRFSLLDYLKIERHSYGDPSLIDKLGSYLDNPIPPSEEETYRLIWELKQKFLNYIDLVNSNII